MIDGAHGKYVQSVTAVTSAFTLDIDFTLEDFILSRWPPGERPDV
jgi:hypothetical protein